MEISGQVEVFFVRRSDKEHNENLRILKGFCSGQE